MPPVAGIVFTRYFFSAVDSSSFRILASQTRCLAFKVTTCTPCVSLVAFAAIKDVQDCTIAVCPDKYRAGGFTAGNLQNLHQRRLAAVGILQFFPVRLGRICRQRNTGRLAVGKDKEQVTAVIRSGDHLHYQFPI